MENNIQLLYYSNALVASHGGRLHSEAFCEEIEKDDRIQKLIRFPKSNNQKNIGSNSKIRKALKLIPALQIFFFYRRNKLSYLEIEKEIEKHKINIIHIRLDSNFLIIEKIKEKYPDILITTEVNASPFEENFKNILFKSYFKKLERSSLNFSDANFFVSNYLRKQILSKPNFNRDYVVPNGVDDKFFNIEKTPKKNKEVIFGYIGTLDFHKNLKVLIDAFKQVQSEKTNTKLLIIGDGPMMMDLKAYVNKTQLVNNVIFQGWVKHDEIVFFLQKFDIAIHHSAQPYMSPLKLFEYMASGLPVIGPDTPAVREIFDGNDLVFTNGEKNDLANKMLYLLDNPMLREEIGKNCKNKVKANYRWKHNAQRIINVMLDKIENRN
ncbi:glycosyltransferase family 4 protein [Gramella sp. MT6]|uniref:glycosyltransferase family 4 protein n=1 Tax=Gramella sp. MT6 TaxID=2705471 RepID=UPI001C5DF72F|nr:glycosyltransferase family 4 protein [Gramella sp. MT6]QYA26040.1 glycosyltransferase family 4 protein [Gramella sp. MT6]